MRDCGLLLKETKTVFVVTSLSLFAGSVLSFVVGRPLITERAWAPLFYTYLHNALIVSPTSSALLSSFPQ